MTPRCSLVGEGGRFPCGPGDDDGVSAVVQMKVKQLPKFFIVDRQIAVHGVTSATAEPLNTIGFLRPLLLSCFFTG